MSDIFIVGVGRTPFGRHLHRTVKDLTREAVLAALHDAGCDAEVLGAAFFANAAQSAMEGQHMVRGQIALRAAGIHSIPIINVENACASASSALYLGAAHLRAGLSEAVLCVGAEKLSSEDKALSHNVFSGAMDLSELQDIDDASPARSVFMDIYAALARDHMERFGTTVRQIARVSSKNHAHSTLNPLAHFQTPFTVEQILAAREIVWPLTLPMCAPVSDGAAAVVLCRGDVLKRLGFEPRRAIRIRACAMTSGSGRTDAAFDQRAGHLAADKAYEEAGVGPRDLSVAEVHDATAFAEILQIENLRLCPPGEGGAFTESGATTFGGGIPVNVSGGLQANGHPIGATGIGQIHELVTQLRGEAGRRQVSGARFGLAQNGGGWVGGEEAAAVITILERL